MSKLDKSSLSTLNTCQKQYYHANVRYMEDNSAGVQNAFKRNDSCIIHINQIQFSFRLVKMICVAKKIHRNYRVISDWLQNSCQLSIMFLMLQLVAYYRVFQRFKSLFQCQSSKSKHTIDSDVEGAKQYLLLETSRVMEINWVSLTDKKHRVMLVCGQIRKAFVQQSVHSE